MKGKQCKHEAGLMYYIKCKLEVTSEVRSVPSKEKRVRPKKLPHFVMRSPTAASAPSSLQQDLSQLSNFALEESEQLQEH